MSLHRILRDDRGNAVVEGAIYMIGILLLFSLIAIGGRLALAHQALEHVAFQAARTASLQRDAGTARSAALADAAATLASQDINCVESDTTVDVSGFNTPLGQAASVTAQTTCRMNLSGFPMMKGTVHLSARASSPIDSYRGR